MNSRDQEGFNPLAGIRCFLTMYNKPGDRELVMSFNPLAGIRCFLTCCPDSFLDSFVYCFNPLAGIRCFLTQYYLGRAFCDG